MEHQTLRETVSAAIARELRTWTQLLSYDESIHKDEVVGVVINAVDLCIHLFERDRGRIFGATRLKASDVHVMQLAKPPFVRVELSPEFEERMADFDEKIAPQQPEDPFLKRIDAILTRLESHLDRVDHILDRVHLDPRIEIKATPEVQIRPSPVHADVFKGRTFYLAGAWSQRDLIENVAQHLRRTDIDVVSTWHAPKYAGEDGKPVQFTDTDKPVTLARNMEDCKAFNMNTTAIYNASDMVVFADFGGRETWFEVHRFLKDVHAPTLPTEKLRLYVFASKPLPLTLRAVDYGIMTVVIKDQLNPGVQGVHESTFAHIRYAERLIEAARF